MLRYKKRHGVLHTFCAAVTPARVPRHYSAESLLANLLAICAMSAEGAQNADRGGSAAEAAEVAAAVDSRLSRALEDRHRCKLASASDL